MKSSPTDIPGVKSVRRKDGKPLQPGQRFRLPDGRIGTATGSPDRGWESEKVRRQVFARDGGRCRNCGSQEDLWVCHAIPWSENPTLRYDLQNLFLLCPRCDPDRNREIVYRRYPWLRRPSTGVSARTPLDNLIGSPLVGMVTLPRLVFVWFLQGLGIFSFFVTPLWILFAVAIGGIPSTRFMAWWLFSMPVATTAGIYLSRYAHRTLLPSRALRALGSGVWRLMRGGGRALRAGWWRVHPSRSASQ